MNRKLLVASLVTSMAAAAFLACNTDTGLGLTDDVPVEGDSGTDATSQGDVLADDSSATDVADAGGGDADASDGQSADAHDAGDAHDASDAQDAACPFVTLTVKDIKNWCTVTIDGGAPFMAGDQTVCAAKGGTVNLVASPNGGFILGTGPWHGTVGAPDGGGELGITDGGSAVTKIIVGDGGAACAWVCCPFPDDSGCPTTNQCP